MDKLLYLLAIVLSSCSNYTGQEYKWIAPTNFEQGMPITIKLAELPDDNIDYRIFKIEASSGWPMQKDDRGMIYFVPTEQIIANEQLVIRESDASENINPCEIVERNGFIIATWAGEEILRYAISTQMPPDTAPNYFQRSGFIHPIKTKSGRTVTAGFPKGHMHQHGMFNAWRSANFRGQFVDFWNQQAELGTVIHQKVLNIFNGPVFSSFKVSLQQVAFIGQDTVPALDETWEIRIMPLNNQWMMDWTIQQQCHGSDSLILDEFHYGGAAFRGCENWNVEDGAFDSLVFFITDEGKTHVDGNHSRPRWAVMHGQTDQGPAGFAVMGHPNNFRHPQPIRIHPTMPYFVFTPSVLGKFHIAPGDLYQSKYRIIVFDGSPPTELINQLRDEF